MPANRNAYSRFHQAMMTTLAILVLQFIHMAALSGVVLPSTIGHNMVLQRNSEVRVWGWAEQGEPVTVKVGWMQEESSVITAANGIWQVKVPTGNAGGPYQMSIKGKDTLVLLENILLGEVWVCSGQSNMEFTINMFGGWNRSYPDARNELLMNASSGIRLFTVEKDTSHLPQNKCRGSWRTSDTASVSSFSATAWFFGAELHKKLGVPVGLIVSTWGGTPAEAWTPWATFGVDSSIAFYRSEPNKNDWFPSSPAVLYNAMISPLLRTTIRGVIWYQGESNVNDAETYDELFPAMVRSWRQAWGLGNFPFYYVQIAPYAYARATSGAMLREAQHKSRSIPNSGMVVTLDITDDVTDIHPVNKPDVGKRLANLALSGTYGFTGIACSGPEFSKLEIDGKAIRLYFDHTEQGLLIRDHAKESGFMIAGSDRHFCPAKAFVEGESIVVRSNRVKEPVAVRYAFSNTSVATLFNGEGLPASTFRTDAWPLYTEMVFIRPEYDATSGILTYGLLCPDQDARIHYTTDGTEPSCNSGIFTKGHLTVASDARITARACLDGNPSESIGSWFVNIHKGIASKVDYVNEYSRKYSAGGRYGLVDGIEGSLSFNDGAWQGFEGEDLLVTIDLGEPTMIRKVVVRFLSDTVSWIFLPRHVEIKTSLNGFHFDTGARFDNLSSLSPVYEKPGKEIVPVRAGFIKNARYIRINARNIGICPAGHPGAGGKAWLFTDEIVIE